MPKDTGMLKKANIEWARESVDKHEDMREYNGSIYLGHMKDEDRYKRGDEIRFTLAFDFYRPMVDDFTRRDDIPSHLFYVAVISLMMSVCPARIRCSHLSNSGRWGLKESDVGC